MKKICFTAVWLLFSALIVHDVYANDTIRWTWSVEYVPATYGFNFCGTDGGRFGIDWGDGQDTVVIGAGELSGYGAYVRHTYADTGVYAVRLYALTADAGITAFSANHNLRTLDVDCPALDRLAFNLNRRLTNLDLSGCTALTSLDCRENNLTSLDVSRNVNLTSLDCSDNDLQSLDVSRNVNLTSLDCSDNDLQSLDVSRNVNLTSLNCYNNQLTSLDVSRNVNLTYLSCTQNNLSFRAVAEMALALPWENAAGGSTTYRFSPQSYPKQTIKSGGSVPVPELPVIKGSRAHLDVYRDGQLVVNQGYMIADNQLCFEEIGNYKLVVWHDSVRERKYGYDENGDWVKMNVPYGDTTFVTVYSEYVSGYDLARWTWEKEQSRDETSVYLSLAGTAGETFVMDWGDGDRTLVDGTGESIQYRHTYDTAARQVEWCLYGATPEARILKLKKLNMGSYIFLNEKLDVSAPELTHLTWGGGYSGESGLVALDVSACKALTHLDCHDTPLRLLDVSKNLNLMYLDCSDNFYLGSLNLSKNIVLTYLDCRNSHQTSLDVSKNLALEELNCGYNGLRSIDVSKNVALASLSCDGNELRTLDVSHNVALRALDCGVCHLTALDVSKNVNLEELDCGYNQLESLDVSGNIALRVLLCYGNYLASLDISRNANLSRLDCDLNPLTSLDVSKNLNLKDLSLGRTQLTSLDVSKNINLKGLDCSYNQLSSLDVSKNINLEGLVFSYNQLSSLDISRNTALRYLSCDGNRLMSLDVSQQPELRCLSFANNRLTSLDLSAQTKLSSSFDGGYYWDYYKTEGNFLEVQLDGLRACDLTALPDMDVERILSVRGGRLEGTRMVFEEDEVTYLYATGYQGDDYIRYLFDTVWFRLVADKQDEPQIPLTAEFFPDSIFRAYVTAFDKDGNDSLCAHECAVVKEIRVGGECEGPLVYWHSPLQSLEGLRYFGNLEELICGAAELTSLDISHNPALEEIYCPHNHLKTLMVSDKPALKYLSCYNNDLTTLTVSNCPKLEDLHCMKNSLTELEINGCPELDDLNCCDNRLMSLDVRHLPELRRLYCQGNDLSDLDVSANLELESVGLSFNHFPLSEIAALRAVWPNDGYDENEWNLSPQYIAVELPIGKALDLSKELWLEEVETEVDFGDIAADAYTFADGRLKFNKAGHYKICLSNEAMRNGIWRRDVYDWMFEPDGIGGVEVFYDITVKAGGSDPDEPGEPDDPDDPTNPGVDNEDLASDEAVSAPWAYVQGRTIYLTEPAAGAGLGEVEAFTAVGQRVYRGRDRAFSVPCAGVYVLRAADGRRCKVMAR